MLFLGSLALFFRGKTVSSLLQFLGAGCLVVVIVTHVFEALHLFPWMHWGLEHSEYGPPMRTARLQFASLAGSDRNQILGDSSGAKDCERN
jgi:hypothetical protein